MEVLSQRGVEKFKEDGHLFTFDKNSASGDKLFWRCAGTTDEGVRCKVRIHTVNGKVVKRLNGHCHGSNAAKVIAEAVKTAVKKKAIETIDQPSQLIHNYVDGLSESVRMALPNIDALKKTVRRVRNISNVVPKASPSAEDLVIPAAYQVYRAGMEETSLIMRYSGTSNDLIFERNENFTGKMDKKNASRRAKRPIKPTEENLWDCSVCTYRNNAEAFKCSMCDVRKGTSTRKPRINPALVASQATTTAGASAKRPRSSNSIKKKRRNHPPRLTNVDRASAQTREVTVNSVTVVITEYKPKKSVSSSSSDHESSDAKP